MEAAVGCKTVTVSEVSDSSGVGCSKGGGGNGGGLVNAPSSWGLGYNGNGGRTEVAARVEATVGWEAKRSSNNNNGEYSSSNFQRLNNIDKSSSSVNPPPPTTAVMIAPPTTTTTITTTTTMVVPPPQGGKGRDGNGDGSVLGDCDSVGGEW